MTKWSIHIWRWSNMPMWVVWRRSGLGRGLTTQGIYQIHRILGKHGATTVRHWLPWCWNYWVFFISCDPTVGVACQEGHNFQVLSLDSRTKNRHSAWVDVGYNALGNLQVMLLKPLTNAWSYHQHREHCNTHSWHWDVVQQWEAAVHPGVRRLASFGLSAATHPAAYEEYCSSWLESAGERPLRGCALSASGRSPMIDCQLSYIQVTLYRCQQYLRDVFCRT